MNLILHIVVYTPVAIAAGAYAYRYRTRVTEVLRGALERIKAPR